MRKRRENGAVAPLLLLLLVLVAAGAWNFKRNLDAEAEEYRPFRGHTDQQVADLLEAYEGRHEANSERWEAAASRRTSARGRGYFGEQVDEFERVQQAARQTRAARDAVAETQTTLKLLQEEEGRRAQERQKLQMFFKRLLTLNL
jgi:hypothetical protein